VAQAHILIVDDHQPTRRTIQSLLESKYMEVCGEAENGKQAVEKVKELKPNIVILDYAMPVMNGIQAAYEIRRVAPGTKILFFSVHDSPDMIHAAHVMGADAFVPKSAAAAELLPALNRLLQSVSGIKKTES
jgi:DNA-binding NarL/FixJ family response regulator